MTKREWANRIIIMSIDGGTSVAAAAAAAGSAKKQESYRLALTTPASTTTGRSQTSNHPLSTSHHLGLCIVLSSLLSSFQVIHHAGAQQAGLAFPGVSRDLASFCSARPSLSIDLAPMLVHVKKNTSFNYKLYLFSNDEHVFQTGQIVPRDDFRVHSFPVKLKHLTEFVPLGDSSLEVYRSRNQTSDLVRVPNSAFSAKRFFARVPLLPETRRRRRGASVRASLGAGSGWSHANYRHRGGTFPHDVLGEMLPGDSVSFAHHDAGSITEDLNSHVPNANEHIEFDRDDQLAVLDSPQDGLRSLNRRHSLDNHHHHHHEHPERATRERAAQSEDQATVLPVGSFSSFRVNHTYLARKDFDQQQVELIRLRVDPLQFRVSRVDILLPLQQQQQQQASAGDNSPSPASPNQQEAASDELPVADDYAFLSHKLLRDASTRLTSISQIYEDWITRNFYTIVYIQRRPNRRRSRTGRSASSEEVEEAASDDNNNNNNDDDDDDDDDDNHQDDELVSERLVFRGSSTVLLGADQLNYHVKASAFITEKNGLHYYLEFLPNGKFYLGAIDWSKRPFKFIDSQRFPIKPTRTQFDNEELLLCPPSVCYSDQPIDELVAYGRLSLSEKLQREAVVLAKSSSFGSDLKESRAMATTIIMPEPGEQSAAASRNSTSLQSESISLDNLTDAVKAASNRLDVRLHLRDWFWQVPRVQQQQALLKSMQNGAAPGAKFAWHYEWAKRNELKVTPDSYGFALVGHEIDAAYRVFNELYLISANQLIAINYTLANETATSILPLEDEFPGLSSSLLDPITGAFYDRYSNQIYFFKGDRYVGYDYATKRPLEDFLLPPAVDDSLGGLGLALMMRHEQAQQQQQPADAKLLQKPLVSSLPVVGILGRQHYVDAIYHDLHEDLVYVLTGMKFYTHQAQDFKDGAFKAPRSGAGADQQQQQQPPMRCINEHLLAGCRFDAAFQNPCKSSDKAHDGNRLSEERPNQTTMTTRAQGDATWRVIRPDLREPSFGEEQQMRLRSIAARGGGGVSGTSNGRLMDYLFENTLVAQGAARAFEPFLGNSGSGGHTKASSRANEQEQIVIYLLIAMVLTTVLVTVAMIVVVLNWARLRPMDESHNGQQVVNRNKLSMADHQRINANSLGLTSGQLLAERPVYPTAISQYLSSQYQQQGRPRPPTSYYYGGPPSQHQQQPQQQQYYTATRRLSSGMPPPMTSAPPIPASSTAEPPARRQLNSQTLTLDYMQNGTKSKRPTQYNSLMNNSAF